MDQNNNESKPGEPKIRVITDEDRQKPAFSKTILFEMVSEVDGKLYAGTFTFKKLTIGGMSKIGRILAIRNGGFPADTIDASVAELNNAIAHLQAWFEDNQDLPPWAKNWDNLMDLQIPLSLFKEGLSFETSFRKVLGERQATPPADSSGQ